MIQCFTSLIVAALAFFKKLFRRQSILMPDYYQLKKMEGCRNVKLQKINLDLNKLDDEINTAIDFLSYLRQYSKECVAKLSQISLSPKNLEEFSQVHSFLKKYLDLVEDINFQFQVLEAKSESDDFKFYSKLDEKENFYKVEKVLINEQEISPVKPCQSVSGEIFRKALLSIASSNCEAEEKEINLESNSHFKKSNVEYKGLPLPIQPAVKDILQDLKKKEMTNNLKMEDKRTYEKDLVICKKDGEKDLNEKEIVDYDYEIPKLVISREPNKQYQGCVEHIVSPGEFYVYFFVKGIEKIEVLKEVIAARNGEYQKKQVYQDPKYMSDMDRKKIAIDCIGDYGLWFDSCDNVWYRVQITDWRLTYDDDLVSVFLIDYGDSNCVSLNTLQPLDIDLRKFPIFAQKCHLAGVYPLESKSGLPMVKWGKESCEMFKILLESSEKCKIITAEHDGCYFPDSIPIRLFATDSDKTINEALVDYDFAKYLKTPPAALACTRTLLKKKSPPPGFRDQPTTASVFPDKLKTGSAFTDKPTTAPLLSDEWNPMKEDYESYRNNYDLDVDDPATAIYGHVGKDFEKICFRFGNTGYCYKGEACRKEHKLFDPDGYSIDEETIYVKALNPLQPPAVGEEFNAQITCITNINVFYCQREVDECEIKPGEETLVSLNTYINERQNVLNFKKLAIPPAVGQIVLGLFKEDQLWYRARIVHSLPEDDKYQLFFVDYGNSDVVPISNIRQIEPKYLHLPFQAMKCQLQDVEPNPDVPKKDAVEYFKAFIDEKTVIAKVVNVINGEGVSLVVKLFDMNFCDIGRHFVSKKFASYRPSILVKDGQLIPG